MKSTARTWNNAVLFYIASVVLLLTLNPFDFQPFTASEFWVWRFSLEDFSRNVLLFFPFGLVLRYGYRYSHSVSFIAGLLLSGTVEVGQLFIEARTSNVVDLISNSSGALLGSLCYQGVFFQAAFATSRPSLSPSLNSLSFAFMLVPLCWVIAIVSSFRPEFVLGMVPCVIAGLSLFRFMPLTFPYKQIGIGIWSIAAILPLLNARPIAGCILLAVIPIILYAAFKFERSRLRIGIVVLLFVSFAIVLCQTYLWFISIENWVWIAARHLSWITLSSSAVVALSSVAWYKSESGE